MFVTCYVCKHVCQLFMETRPVDANWNVAEKTEHKTQQSIVTSADINKAYQEQSTVMYCLNECEIHLLSSNGSEEISRTNCVYKCSISYLCIHRLTL